MCKLVAGLLINKCQLFLGRYTVCGWQPITAAKTYAGGHQSICNKCRFAKDNHFALQMRRNILSLLVIFG